MRALVTLGVVSFLGACFGDEGFIEESRTVQTEQGLVEGYLTQDGIFSFSGLRYAKPIKFRAPTEALSHSGVFKANEKFVSCPQFPSSDVLSMPSDNEDCLILNVFTPRHFTANASLPVMVFLHGGEFSTGCSSPLFYSPQYLVPHDIVLVTVNYRLGLYGCLNLGMKEAPGNACLKDVRAALRWLKRNIKGFGGNPDNVTVFGHEAGAAIAVYLTLSSSTKGLVNRIIVQSGSVFTPFAYDANPLATAEKVAKVLGVTTNDPQILCKTFETTPVRKVLDAIATLPDARSLFAPSLEIPFENEEPFLLDTPYNIIASGIGHPCFHPVPVIAGNCILEGLAILLNREKVVHEVDAILENDYSVLEPKSLAVPTAGDRRELINLLRNTYLGNETTTDKSKIVGGLVNLATDFGCVGPMSVFMELYANNSKLPMYSYIFQHLGQRNFGRIMTNTTFAATTRMDELFYLFELDRAPLPMNDDDIKIVALLSTLWTTFARNGVPSTNAEGSADWAPYPYFLSLEPVPQYVGPLTPERTIFFKEVYFKYGCDIRRH